jgi:hypothetical protein
MVTRVAGWAWRRHGFLRGCVVRQLSGCELGNSRTGAGEESSALLPCGRHHSAAEDLLCSVVLFDAGSRSFGSERIMHWLFADRVPLHNTVVQQLLVGTRTVKPRMKVGGFRLTAPNSCWAPATIFWRSFSELGPLWLGSWFLALVAFRWITEGN